MLFSNHPTLQHIVEVTGLQWLTDHIVWSLFGKRIERCWRHAFARIDAALLWVDPEVILYDLEQDGAVTRRVEKTLKESA